MPKKSTKPDYEFSQKTNRNVKTGRLRQRENHERLTKNLGRLKAVQGCPSVNHSQAVEMAADNLASQPAGGLARFLLSLAHVFFEPLEYQLAQVNPVDHYWRKFVDLVEAQDQNFAQALLTGGYEQSFRWLAFGHVQRLSVLFEQRPEAVKTVEIYEDSVGKITPVARCNDGKSFVIPEDYFNEAPEVYFPGERFTLPVHPDDAKRLEGQPKQIWVPTSPEPLKARPTELLRQALLVNVGLPDDISRVEERMKHLPYPAHIAKLRQP